MPSIPFLLKVSINFTGESRTYLDTHSIYVDFLVKVIEKGDCLHNHGVHLVQARNFILKLKSLKKKVNTCYECLANDHVPRKVSD